MKKTYLFLLVLITFVIASFKITGNKRLAKVTTNDDYDYIAINQILMWMSNNGNGSYDPLNARSGFFWPKDSLNSRGFPSAAIFEDGIVWGGKIKTLPDSIQIQVGGSTYNQGLQAGKILANGQADDPNNPRYRIYKIRKDWQELAPGPMRDRFQKDYDEWPVLDGAPWVDVDNDMFYKPGLDSPKFIGDEVVWFVSNDQDSSRIQNLYGSNPIGIEQQTTVWGFNRVKDLANMVFKKVTLINKGKNQIDSMYVTYWSDPDLGDAGDDYVGTDTTLDMIFTFNGNNEDQAYPGVPPALGVVLIQGPVIPATQADSAFVNNEWGYGKKNKEINSSMYFIGGHGLYRDPRLRDYRGTLEMYNYMKGRIYDGSLIIDPITLDTITFAVPGDPVTGTGWYDGTNETAWVESPGDRRVLYSSGPFTFAPGDTQEVVFAYVIGRGADRLDSISKIRRMARIAKDTYLQNFKTKLPPSPQLHGVGEDNKIVLHWERNAEDFKSLIQNVDIEGLEDSTYNFEGYFVYQYRDADGADPRLIEVYDLRNDIINLRDYRNHNGVYEEQQIIQLNNSGLKRKVVISTDAYSGKSLYNGSPYYFGVTSFAYNKNAEPHISESKPHILKVRPGLALIDKKYFYERKNFIPAIHQSGFADALVGYRMVNPDLVEDKDYQLSFIKKNEGFYFNFLEEADTLLNNKRIDANDTTLIFNGVRLILENTGLDSLLGETSRIKSVEEIHGPGSVKLKNPFNILSDFNSTGKWRISNPLQDVDIRDAMKWHSRVLPGRETYEIRFTPTGSEYYLTGYTGGFPTTSPFKDDPKAPDRVPFEIWTLGEDPESSEDDMQLIIKIRDKNAEDLSAAILDSSWSHFPIDDSLHADEWEQVFAYFPPDSLYQEPLADMSGLSNNPKGLHKFGKFILQGELPEEGTVIRIDTWRPLTENDVFVFSTTAPDTADYAGAKTKLDKISVFPNPYFGIDPFGRFPNQNFMRFINLPQKVTVRIFTIAGQLVQKIEKENSSPWLDWDLKNLDGKVVASGIYIAHLEMPHIGKKIMKLAVVQDNK